jgi:hypothetical protein
VAVPDRTSLTRALRVRLLPHLSFFLLVWPLACAGLGMVFLREQPITGVLDFEAGFAGIIGGTLELLPELLQLGVLIGLVSALFFAFTRVETRPLALGLEPLAALFAIAAGISMELPALLWHPMLMPVRLLPVVAAQLAVLLVALGIAAIGPKRRTIPAALLFLLAWGVAVSPHAGQNRTAPRDSVFILGLDSLSQSDALDPLRRAVAGSNGTWYQHPVTPGLLTNSVWTAIVQHRQVHETGVFLTYQLPDWKRSPYQLVSEGKRRGFESWSFFSDQFTTHIGSMAGFDVDRSGPVGWLQLATAAVKETHILAPVLLPRLPRLPFARTPRNQSGTFGFRLSTELHDFFTAGSRDAKILAAGHVDYLHQAAYPAMSDLTPAERGRVRRANAAAIRDLSLHWQYPEWKGEPLGIYAWKIARLQHEVAKAMRDTGASDPARRNRIIILSDHGNRKDIAGGDFARQRYYKVLFATIGIPGHDPRKPVSLVDIPLLLDWPDPSRPGAADLVVEYVNNESPKEWVTMMESAVLARNGTVLLDPKITAAVGQRLLAYRPHSGVQAYEKVPVVPTELTLKAARYTSPP